MVLRVDDTEYRLAAIIYGNGVHFCCTVVVLSKACLYDGMKASRCVRSPLTKVRPPEGYLVNQVWYLRQTNREQTPDPEANDEENEDVIGIGEKIDEKDTKG